MSYFFSIKRIFFLALVCIFFACGKKKGEETVTIPARILNEEKFTKILTDFALAESAANMNIKGINLQKLDSVYAFNPLLENKITKPQYDSSVSFYVNHPGLYKKVYENVLVALSEMRAKRNPVVKDTISK